MDLSLSFFAKETRRFLQKKSGHRGDLRMGVGFVMGLFTGWMCWEKSYLYGLFKWIVHASVQSPWRFTLDLQIYMVLGAW